MQLLRNDNVDAAAPNAPIFKIGDLAREFNVSLRTLRFYEDKGIVSPERAGTTRLYTAADREALRLALFGKRIGLTLENVRKLLDLHDTQSNEAREQLLQVYEAQLEELKAVQVETQTTISDLTSLISLLNDEKN